MSLLTDLDRVRQMQGRDPMPDPTKIQGFGPDDPPQPDYLPPAISPDLPPEWIDPELDVPRNAQASPQSPLMALGAQGTKAVVSSPPAAPAALPDPGQFQMIVCDRVAAWKGRSVELSEADEKAVRLVVIRAIQREVQADLEAVVPRRKRRARAATTTVAAEHVDSPPRVAVRVKRGRPGKARSVVSPDAAGPHGGAR